MTALYRAYRPQRFDDVVGQQAAVRTLRNAISSGRVAHAYLFTGSKGTGKTTMAKLLAKALNCEQGPTPDPCGVCESCVAIAESRSMDVAEIDAASNNGIDAVREKIIDTVAFRPSSGTRRVYILDEAHQLSTSAFNALLKTIEEPPDHVLFVFCTTETHKMMATVRDRCQRITLAPPNADDLLGVLQRVAEREGIQTDEQALRAVARMAEGSFRNALGMLEMLTTAFDGSFSHADVLAHLGAFSEELLFAASDAVITRSAGDVLRTVEQLVQEGQDASQFASELAEHLRTVLLARHGVESASVRVGDTARLAAQAQQADEQHLLAAIDCLNDALTRIRVGSDARLAVETALVRASQGLGLPSIALRLAMLEHSVNGGYGQPLPAAQPPQATAQHAQPAASTQPARAAVASAAPATPPAASAAASAAPAASPPAAPAAAPAAPAATEPAPGAAPRPAHQQSVAQVADAGDLSSWWPRLVAQAEPASKAVVAMLTPVAVSGTALVVEAAAPGMVTDRVKEKLRAQVEQLTGRKLTIDLREAGSAAGSPATATPAAASTGQAAPSRTDGRAAAVPAAMSASTATASGTDAHQAVPDDRDDYDPDSLTDMPADGVAAPSEAAGSADDLSLFQSTFNATELQP